MKKYNYKDMQVTDLFLGLGESLVGKTCGFLGLGKIGLATARRQQTNRNLNKETNIRFQPPSLVLLLSRKCIQASAFWDLKTDLHEPEPERACFSGDSFLG